MTREPFRIGRLRIRAGTTRRLELPAARIPAGTELTVPVIVAHGAKRGKRVLLDAALHGDEINGVEIILKLMDRVDPAKLSGTIVAVPIVNVFGFLYQDRYLPDRRDLNRSFPGSPSGSLAARLANLFYTQLVEGSDAIIDMHTGSLNRANLPQIRANLSDEQTLALARTFGAPVIVDSKPREGSLRQVAHDRGIPCLVYEAGEPHRFDPAAVRHGVDGVLRVLEFLKMYRHGKGFSDRAPLKVHDTKWVRASRSGILRPDVELGTIVRKKQELGSITDALGRNALTVRAPFDGVVVGMQLNPLVYRGDALFHVAEIPEEGWQG